MNTNVTCGALRGSKAHSGLYKQLYVIVRGYASRHIKRV